MHIGKIFRTAISYIPVVRCIVDLIASVLSVSASASSEIEAKIKEVEAIGRWLRDNNVNTFSEYYDKTFKKEEE